MGAAIPRRRGGPRCLSGGAAGEGAYVEVGDREKGLASVTPSFAVLDVPLPALLGVS